MVIDTPPSTQWLDTGATAWTTTGGGVHTNYGDEPVYDAGAEFGTTEWKGVLACLTTDVLTNHGQLYLQICEGSTTDDFTGDVCDLATINSSAVSPLSGDEDGTRIPDVAYLSNLVNGVYYRYFRVKKSVSVAGVFDSSLTSKIFVQPLGSIDTYSPTDTLKVLVAVAENDRAANLHFRRWMTGAAWGGDSHDGKYPISDGLGNIVYLKCPAQLAAESSEISPIFYGAIADGSSHKASLFYDTLENLQVKYPFATSLDQEMDFLAVQTVCYMNTEVKSQPATFVMCNSTAASQKPLIVVSGQSWWRVTNARFYFPDMLAKTPTVELVPDPTFDAGTGWANATIYNPTDHVDHDDATFTGGHALGLDIRTTFGEGPFYQFGVQITAAPNRYRAKCRFKSTKGGSYDTGNGNPPYASIQFCGTSPGEGDNFSGRSASTNPDVFADDADTHIYTLQFDFTTTESQTSWFTFSAGGYQNVEVLEMSITDFVGNCGVLMTRDGSPEHYPIMQPLEGVWIIGPDNGQILTGVLYKSFENIDGNIGALDSQVITGWDTALAFSDGGYLPEIRSVHIYGNRCGVFMNPGSYNAGENLRFKDGGIYNNQVAVDNPGGAEITFTGTAIDYNTQTIINNAGKVDLHGLRIEQFLPTDETKPLFHCLPSGRISWFGGFFLGAGAVGESPCEPVKLDGSHSAMTLFGVLPYNMAGASGRVSSGAGIFRSIGLLNSGNPNMGELLSDCAAMDVLGGAGKFQSSGGFGDDTAHDIYLEGGQYTYDGTMIDRWNSSTMTIERSDDFTYNGSQCLKVTKMFGVGSGGQIRLLIPARPGENILGHIRFKFPQVLDADSVDSNPLYFRLFWVRQIGYSSFGQPTLAPNMPFKGEVDIQVPLAGSGDIVSRGLSTLYQNESTDPTAGISPYAPFHTTHLGVFIDPQSLPDGSIFYILDIVPNVLG